MPEATISVDKPLPQSTFLRLLVELPQAGSEPERALRQAVADSLPPSANARPWRVARMFEPTPELSDALARYYEVTGEVATPRGAELDRVAWDLAYALRDAADVAVEPDLPSSAFAPEDPFAPEQLPDRGGEDTPVSQDRHWPLASIRAPQAWALTPLPGGAARGAGIRIGHPDTGYSDHPELAGVYDLTLDRDVVADDDDARDALKRRAGAPLDNPGHGTSTATSIASRDSGEVTGAAPLATVVPIRAIHSVVQVFDSDVAKAVDHARRAGCHVISMSLGGKGFFGLRAAVREAVDSGMIVMAAAGNNVRFVTAPASYPECIAVAAVSVDDQPWSGSSRGGKVAFSAPGGNVWTSGWVLDDDPPTPKVNTHSGTSFAVAHSAGVAALWLAHHGRPSLLARYPGRRLQAAFLHLVSTVARRVPPFWDDGRYGVGIIDADVLLRAGLPADADVDLRARAMDEETEDPLDRLNRVVPELDRLELADRVSSLLGVPLAELPAALDRYGPELVSMLSEDVMARDAVAGGAGEDGTRAMEPSGAVARGLIRSASSELRGRLAAAATPVSGAGAP